MSVRVVISADFEVVPVAGSYDPESDNEVRMAVCHDGKAILVALFYVTGELHAAIQACVPYITKLTHVPCRMPAHEDASGYLEHVYHPPGVLSCEPGMGASMSYVVVNVRNPLIAELVMDNVAFGKNPVCNPLDPTHYPMETRSLEIHTILGAVARTRMPKDERSRWSIGHHDDDASTADVCESRRASTASFETSEEFRAPRILPPRKRVASQRAAAAAKRPRRR